jgi:hypothetical protein
MLVYISVNIANVTPTESYNNEYKNIMTEENYTRCSEIVECIPLGRPYSDACVLTWLCMNFVKISQRNNETKYTNLSFHNSINDETSLSNHLNFR